MAQKKNKLKTVIIILIVLLVISASALTGTLIYNYLAPDEQTTVDVPGNIITPESENSTEPNTDAGQAEASETSSSASAGGFPGNEDKTGAITLYTRYPEENAEFRIENMFPGDVETKYFRIKVYYKGDITVRYHADIRPGYDKLADVLKVKVRLPETGETLYDGLMRDMPESLNNTLFTNMRTQTELYYEITSYLDTSVGDEYQNEELIVDFRWWVEEVEHLDAPQTGAAVLILLLATLATGSFLCIVILLAKRRKESADAC